MPKLNDVQCRNARLPPDQKTDSLTDGGDLVLELRRGKNGATLKGWRLTYLYRDPDPTSPLGHRLVRRQMSLGAYPAVSLAEARVEADKWRALVKRGGDPVQARRLANAPAAHGATAVPTFAEVAELWFTKNTVSPLAADGRPTARVWAASNARVVRSRLDRFLLPLLGVRPIDSIDSGELLTLLQGIEARGAVETARRCHIMLNGIFGFARVREWRKDNPADCLTPELLVPKVEHHAAITDPVRLGEVLRMFDAYHGSAEVRTALRLMPLFAVRPYDLRHARWDAFDLEAGEWRFIMAKGDVPHIVPLAPQAVASLQELRPLTGHCGWVFPSARRDGRPMSSNGVLSALRALGLPKDEVSGHGFRATFRSMAREHLSAREDLLEHQLGHVVKDALGRAYNRTTFLAERHALMCQWADYLDSLKALPRPSPAAL